MRKTLVLLAVLAAASYVLGERARRPDAKKKQHTLLQRAALLWTSPRLTPVRRAVRHRTRGHHA